jgi:hypothetical protein
MASLEGQGKLQNFQKTVAAAVSEGGKKWLCPCLESVSIF